LELDEIGKSGGIKRKAVNIDGDESDSSTENFDLRATNTPDNKHEFRKTTEPLEESDADIETDYAGDYHEEIEDEVDDEAIRTNNTDTPLNTGDVARFTAGPQSAITNENPSSSYRYFIQIVDTQRRRT